MSVIIKPYIPEDGIELCGDVKQEHIAYTTLWSILHQQSGSAFSAFDGNKLIGSAGIATNVGEAWLVMSQKCKEELAGPEFSGQKRAIITNIRDELEKIMRERQLWRVYARTEHSECDERFLRYLGFKLKDEKLFVR